MSTTYIVKHDVADHYRVFASREDGVMPDGTTTLRHRGCNGVKHVEEVIVAWLHADGEVDYAEPREMREMGACDGSCGTTALGSFIYPLTLASELEEPTA